MSRLLLLLFSLATFGCATAPAPEHVVPLKEIHYWRLTKDGVVSTLLGTIHQGVSRSELPPQVISDIKKSSSYVAEDNYSRNVEGLGRRKSYELPLSKRLSPKLYARFLKAIDGKESPGEKIPVEDLSPLGAFTALELSISNADNRNEQVSFDGAIDDELQEEAKALGIPQAYLEDAKTTALCDDKAYLQAIEVTLSRNPKSYPSAKDMLAAYKNGETKSLVLMMERIYEGMPLLKSCLFRDREKLWVSSIESWHRSGSLFIAVGVGHMIYGELPRFLTERGFTIKPIQF